MTFVEMLGLATVPSLLVSLVVRHYFARFERKGDERAKARKEEQYLLMKKVDAIGSLAEATGRALKNGHTNGEMTEALEYYSDQKHEMRDFLARQSVDVNHE